mmetsp:Transcript_24788/g.69042  ORF Transcript_24788/g.69042 Transcript_24788/m.69042 type:complete len:316 (+) Transcript_24788:2243-3190(+)
MKLWRSACTEACGMVTLSTGTRATWTASRSGSRLPVPWRRRRGRPSCSASRSAGAPVTSASRRSLWKSGHSRTSGWMNTARVWRRTTATRQQAAAERMPAQAPQHCLPPASRLRGGPWTGSRAMRCPLPRRRSTSRGTSGIPIPIPMIMPMPTVRAAPPNLAVTTGPTAHATSCPWTTLLSSTRSTYPLSSPSSLCMRLPKIGEPSLWMARAVCQLSTLTSTLLTTTRRARTNMAQYTGLLPPADPTSPRGVPSALLSRSLSGLSTTRAYPASTSCPPSLMRSWLSRSRSTIPPVTPASMPAPCHPPSWSRATPS